MLWEKTLSPHGFIIHDDRDNDDDDGDDYDDDGDDYDDDNKCYCFGENIKSTRFQNQEE
jgi:hypothetical protein